MSLLVDMGGYRIHSARSKVALDVSTTARVLGVSSEPLPRHLKPLQYLMDSSAWINVDRSFRLRITFRFGSAILASPQNMSPLLEHTVQALFRAEVKLLQSIHEPTG